MKSRAKNKGRDGGGPGASEPKLPFPAEEGRGGGSLSADALSQDPHVVTTHHGRTKSPAPSSMKLRGVRTHNLKAIDLDLPLKQLIVITGPSGAGKSSLALDTLYAEGHRRYVETFSPYARQFLVRLDKPDAELIAGIPPAIAVMSPRVHHSPRSTIGTVTEVHHVLGLLFARAGQVVCRQCGEHVAPASPESVSRAIEAMPEGTRYEVGFPLEIRSETDQAALFASLRTRGFTRFRIDGQSAMLDGPYPAAAGSMRPASRSSSTAWSAAAIVSTAAPIRSKQPLKRGSDDAGSSHRESRKRSCAVGDAADAERTTSSLSPRSFATTARWAPAPPAKEPAGRWNST